MFDRVTIRAADLAASARFYRHLLGEPTRTGERHAEWEEFAIAQADSRHPPTAGAHVGFVARSRADVDAFHARGVAEGHRDDGGPGPRPQYKPSYYGAFLLDPEGNSAEAGHYDDIRHGGVIDHLWIGVVDLERAAGFYDLIAPHVGVRRGVSWDEGRQFCGAWATMALVADGRPPTTGLQLTFRVPRPRIVDDFHAAVAAAGHAGEDERPHSRPGGYAASAHDPDGTVVEVLSPASR